MEKSSSWDSALYEHSHSFVWKFGADLVPLLNPQAGERIIDLGCGTGQLTAKIAESGARVVGIDRSPDMVGQARRNFPGVEFQLADATSFEVTELADAVFSNAALHWVRDAEAAARSIARALKPGGRFVAEFGGKNNIARFLEGMRAALGRLGLADGHPWYFPSVGEYAGILESCGLEIRYAALFDRPTALENGERGLADWIHMFGGDFLARVPAAQQASFFADVAQILKPQLFREGGWWMDYRRLRVVAVRLT